MVGERFDIENHSQYNACDFFCQGKFIGSFKSQIQKPIDHIPGVDSLQFRNGVSNDEFIGIFAILLYEILVVYHFYCEKKARETEWSLCSSTTEKALRRQHLLMLSHSMFDRLKIAD